MRKREIEHLLLANFFKGRAIIVVGARQTGKTTLIQQVIGQTSFGANFEQSVRHFNCDNPTDRAFLNNRNIEFLTKLIGKANIIFIDEGQKVETIGQTLKLLVDHYKKEKQILVTGSSSFNLLNNTQEALTGRKLVFTLYPLSLRELYPDMDHLRMNKEVEINLIYGMYPDIALQDSLEEKRQLLVNLAESALYKDTLEFVGSKKSSTLSSLLKVLALQIGSEVSMNELANTLGAGKNIIERYIDLLEQSNIIFRLSPFTQRKRREISKLKKIYFIDVGIRNAIINNFNALDTRTDSGALWENFMILERLKMQSYYRINANNYFWRTYDGSGVDFVEERDGKLYGYEFTLRPKGRRVPEKWRSYPNSEYIIVHTENFYDVLQPTDLSHIGIGNK